MTVTRRCAASLGKMSHRIALSNAPPSWALARPRRQYSPLGIAPLGITPPPGPCVDFGARVAVPREPIGGRVHG